jgi:hypothetical protein
MVRRMPLKASQLPDNSTAEEAAAVLAGLLSDVDGIGPAPTVRTLRLWKSRSWLTRGSRAYTRRNLLEVLAIVRLRSQGYSTAAAAQRCLVLDEDRLLRVIADPETPSGRPVLEYGRITLDLLARGILEQFRLAGDGAVVGHSGNLMPGIPHTAGTLRIAAARLGRLYFEEGREDRAASAHALLRLCTQPLRNWAPAALSGLAGSAVLIDAEYLVPSEDCDLLARQSDGVNAEDLVEHRLHEELISSLVKLPDRDAATAYTSIREFIGRHALASVAELHGVYARPELPTAAADFVRSLYSPVHAGRAVSGMVTRCRFCRALVDPDGRCRLSGCQEDHPRAQTSEQIPVGDALEAAPEVLKYWVDPAREELRIYDALRRRRLAASLYPHSDRCDVALGDDIGIDVKDYRDPTVLARRLNQGIGGLAYYPRAILAVADRRARIADYIGRIREQLSPSVRARLEVRSVSETVRTLLRESRNQGEANARPA